MTLLKSTKLYKLFISWKNQVMRWLKIYSKFLGNFCFMTEFRFLAVNMYFYHDLLATIMLLLKTMKTRLRNRPQYRSMHLPLINKNIISRLLTNRLKFITICDTTCTNGHMSYIGKKDRCLRTIIKEHATDRNTEAYKHTEYCKHLHFVRNLLNLPSPQLDLSRILIDI